MKLLTNLKTYLNNMSKFKTPSKASPRAGARRGCLCSNGTFSTKCCEGSFESQGIGKTEGTGDTVTATEVSGVRTIVRQNG